MRPEEALSEARRRAAEARARGEYAASGPPLVAEGTYDAGRRLVRWAIIEPERAQVYSTRRLGAPITALKRLLLRLLRQYVGEVTAQQIRFNAHAAAHMLALEDRVRLLEEQLAAQRPAPPES